MEDENLTLTLSNTSGETSNSLQFVDPSGSLTTPGSLYVYGTDSGSTSPSWQTSNWSGMFIAPTPPEGKGAPGEEFVDNNGYTWVYSNKDEWLQVNKVQGPFGVSPEDVKIVKHEKKKLKCF